MALGKNCEEMLKHMDPKVAEAQRAFWEANPAIAAAIDQGAVPQSEFNRQMNEKDEKVKAAEKTSKEWKDWADRNKPKQEKLITDYEAAQQKIVDLEAKVKAGARVETEITGTDIDEDKLMAAVEKRLGGKPASEARIAQIVAEEAKKISDNVSNLIATERKEFFEKTVPGALAWQADMLDVMLQHDREFKKPLDRAAFSKFMTDNKLTDPKDAYAKFTDGDRRKTEIETEVNKRVDAELAKRNIPGVSSTTGETGSGRGVMELKIAGETPKFPEGTALGDLSAAAQAAAELRKEGAAA